LKADAITRAPVRHRRLWGHPPPQYLVLKLHKRMFLSALHSGSQPVRENPRIKIALQVKAMSFAVLGQGHAPILGRFDLLSPCLAHCAAFARDFAWQRPQVQFGGKHVTRPVWYYPVAHREPVVLLVGLSYAVLSAPWRPARAVRDV
jgi:hypothetical protein